MARLMARDDSPVASKQSWSLARPVAVSSTAVLPILSVALAAMIQGPLTLDAGRRSQAGPG